MKKKETKKRTQQHNNDLSDFGLEPPKIYRDSQGRVYSPPEKKQRVQKAQMPMTKHEQRQQQSKKRKKKNKIRKFFIWAAIAIVLVAVGAVLSLTVFFNIESITVVGNEKYSEDEILTQCTVDLGENLFLADTKEASKMIEQTLPYIYTAKLNRKLPSAIVIEVTESELSYFIKNNDKTYILLDDKFKVLEDKAEKAKGIEISKAEISSAVVGHTLEFGDENVAECLNKMAQCISDNNVSEITGIYSNNLSDNYFVYDGRIEFKIGTCDDLDKKLWQGLSSCEQLNESSPNAKGTMIISGDKQIYFAEDFS